MDNKMTISRPRIKTPAKKNWVRRHPRNRIDTTAEIGTNDNNTIACCHFMDQRLRLQAHVVLFLYSVTSLAAGGAIAQVYCAKNSNGLIKRTQTVVMLNGFN